MTRQTSVTARARERETRALELRACGATFQQISDALRFGSAANAHRCVRRALNREPAQAVDELRRVESARLDMLWRSLWPKVAGGSAAHAAILVRISERRCKLLGLDAPSRLQVGPSEQDETITRLVEELLAMPAAGQR